MPNLTQISTRVPSFFFVVVLDYLCTKTVPSRPCYAETKNNNNNDLHSINRAKINFACLTDKSGNTVSQLSALSSQALAPGPPARPGLLRTEKSKIKR